MRATHTPELLGIDRRRIYSVWSAMHARCSDRRRSDYVRYGGAGVSVCERWSSFAAFLADMGPRPTGTSIDRIDGRIGYEPGNCRWATSTEQNRNRPSINRLLTFNGQTMCLAAWAQETGLQREVIRDRLDKLGWSVAEALTSPIKREPISACRNGHARVSANVYVSPGGRIQCRACNGAAVARSKLRKSTTGEQA